MVKKNADTYVCKRRFLYNGLTKMGFKPYKVAPDMYDCNRLVWLYDDSKELRDAIEKLSTAKES